MYTIEHWFHFYVLGGTTMLGVRPKILTSVLVSLLFLTPMAFIPSSVGASTTITTFTGGAKDVNMTFASPGTDTSVHMALPKGCTVSTATISLEGLPLKAATPSTLEYNFNDTINNQVWTGTSATNISASNATPPQWQAGAGNGNPLAKDDDIRLQTMNKQQPFSYQQFSFKVDMIDITDITINWNGFGWYNNGAVATYYYGVHLFIWNNQTQAWDKLGQYDVGKGTVSVDYWINKTMNGNLDKYLYNHDEIRVLGSQLYSGNGGFGITDIESDFIKATVTGKFSSYATNVTLDVGDDGTVDFTHDGPLMGMDTYAGNLFVSLLQSKVTAAGQGYGDFDIPLAIATDGIGIVRIGNLSIVLDTYVNKEPEVDTFPSNIHFPEDTTATNLINLTTYFSDDLDKSTELTYTLVNESDPLLIHATVTTHGLMSFTTPTKDWFGNASFKVKGTDKSGLSVTSDAFNVRVDPVPDAPVLQPIGPLSFLQDKPSLIQISATDPDQLYGGVDPLTYSAVFETGSPFFTLGTKTGKANFAATEDNIGNYTVNFTVTDSHGLSDSEVVAIKVIDVNKAPVLSPIGKQVLTEHTAYTLQLTATDEDHVDEGKLVFSVTFLDSDPFFTMGPDGYISFTPNQSVVGIHHVRFTVTDSVGNKGTANITYEIKNVNDPPTISPVADQKVNRNTPFSLKVNASDPDLAYSSEVLVFSSDSKLFDINEITGWINFTPKTAQAGKYTIKVSVTDLAGATASTSFKLEIVKNNTAPDAKIVVTGNKTKVKAGATVVMTAVATDKDNDPLTYSWSENGKALGTDKELTLAKMSAGTHTITLEVSDGITKTTVTQVIKVDKNGKGLPGFGADITLLALAFVAIVSFVAARKRN